VEKSSESTRAGVDRGGWRRHLMLGMLFLALGSLLLAGCSMQTVGQTSVAKSTATTAPTATPSPTPSPTPVPQALINVCFGANASQAGQVIEVGDMLYTQVTLGFLSYPNIMLPDNTPLAQPLKIHSSGPDAYTTDFPNSPLTNLSISSQGGGFYLGVCNASTNKSHTVQAVTSKIAFFAGYNGQLNEWNGCDGATDSHHQLMGGGCGGGIAGCVCFHATFPNNAVVGTEVTMTQTDDSLNNPGDHAGKLPLALAPHHAVYLFAAMDKPIPNGRYTFTFGVRIDGQNTSLSSGPSPIVLLAPVAYKWTGQACQQPAMLNQINVTNPETYYICPQ
jgi:hypothetical protein